MNTEIAAGKIYRVRSDRKGTFTGKLVKLDDTWATILITEGTAKAMMEYNEGHQGDEVTVRRSFCNFVEIKEPTHDQ